MNLAFSGIRACYQQYLPYVKEDTPYLVKGLLLILGLALSNAVLIWAIGRPFDALFREQYSAVLGALGIIAVVVAFNQAFHVFSAVSINHVGLRFVGRLRGALFQHVLTLSYPRSSEWERGDLLARLGNDVDKVQELVVEQASYLVSHVLTIFLYLFMLFWINWQLALLAFALTPLFWLQQHFFGKRKRHAAANFLQQGGQLVSEESQGISQVRAISTFNAQKWFASRHRDQFAKALHWAMKERWLDALFRSSFSILVYLSGLLVIVVGVQAIESGDILLGELISFLLYLGYLSVPVQGLAQFPFQAQVAVAASQRVQEVMQAQPERVESPSAGTLQVSRGEVRFDAVTFAYANQACVLDDVSFEIPAGQTWAVVGPSGAGKSTLAYLLSGFIVPQNGQISIDDQDISGVSLTSLREHIAVVWQEPFLIADSVEANLRLANPDAAESSLRAALEAAGAWDFISQLPDGLATRIGEGGVTLSVGQSQRLSIAQAFLRDASILVLDEASAALDSSTESQLVESLHRLRRGKTTLMIAHRYTSLRHADAVLYLNGDGSVNVGSHSQLLADHQGYREAVEWQTGFVLDR